ncbi:hypothetical protein [Amycolatopsis sp. NPDC004378]
MAIRLKLGNYETVKGDPLSRSHVGYFPRMTELEAWEAGRGVWKMNVEKASRQRFALIIGEGRVRAVAEITGVTVHNTPGGERVALEGRVLDTPHAVRDAYFDAPDPVVNGSQNPIGYCELPEEAAFLIRPCACGCGETSDRDFLPGHDVRAIQARVRAHFGGSPLAFVTWVDSQLTGERTEVPA